MGDDLSLPERNGVRTPMQWSAEAQGGFTAGAGQPAEGEDHSEAADDGRHCILPEPYSYRWSRVGGLDCVLRRSVTPGA